MAPKAVKALFWADVRPMAAVMFIPSYGRGDRNAFAELAGAFVPDSVDGMSLLPLLNNKDAAWRDAILIEHWPTEDGVGSKIPEFYAVRTVEWKYVEYSTGETELFDLKDDPYELDNVTNSLDYTNIKAELKQKLDELKDD